MARKRELQTSHEELVVSATTAAAELKYERCTNAVEILAKDEHVRKLRLSVMLLQDQVNDLHEKVWEEVERGEDAVVDAETWQARAEKANEDLDHTSNELRLKTRELDVVKTELSSLQNVATDSTKLLREKLVLTSELASFQAVIDHLRTQAASNKDLLAEKFSLERQLSTMHVELNTERYSLQQALANQGKKSEQDAEHLTEIEGLRKELAKAKRDLSRALKEAAKAEQVDELKEELAREKRGRERAEKNAEKAGEVEELRQELAKEKLEREKAEKNTDMGEQVEDLKKQLAKEKREREESGKQAAKVQTDSEAQKAIVEDKLNQFRTKLKSTKEKLKETEGELLQARTLAAARQPPVTETRGKNSRKRGIAQMDPDATTGTPGDAGPSKRGKRASSIVGEKSTFSITPFLNRTMSVAPESPAKHVSDDAEDEPVASIEGTGSPTSKRAKPAPSTRQPLGPASAGRTNTKAGRKKAVAASTLELVAEEDDSDAENAPLAVVAVAEAAKREKLTLKPTLKPKSLSSFASFRDISLPPQQQVQKKKRKLLGASAKTIFDDKEDEDGADFAVGRGAFGGQRAFGAFAGRGFGGLGLLGGMKKKGPLVVAADGFAFSPLKRERKVAAAAAAEGGVKT